MTLEWRVGLWAGATKTLCSTAAIVVEQLIEVRIIVDCGVSLNWACVGVLVVI